MAARNLKQGGFDPAEKVNSNTLKVTLLGRSLQT